MKVVVKVGGSLLKNGTPDAILDDVALLSRSAQVAIVHGGGDLVTDMATRLGKEQRFIVSPGGIRSRYTDRETAEIYTMVMSGLIAKRLVLGLRRRGVNAASLSGLDAALFSGRRKKKLAVLDERGRKVVIEGGYTGRVESVNAALIGTLLDSGYVPVVSPVALGEEFEPLNIDGDRAASTLAVGLSADTAIFTTNVDGLMLDEALVERLQASEVQSILPRVGFGMQKKVIAAAEAVKGGVARAIICSGTRKEPLTKALAQDNCTVVQ